MSEDQRPSLWELFNVSNTISLRVPEEELINAVRSGHYNVNAFLDKLNGPVLSFAARIPGLISLNAVEELLRAGAETCPEASPYKGGWSALFEAANYGNLAYLELFLKYHADAKEVGHNNYTALHVVAERTKGNPEDRAKMVDLLAAAGADINAKTADNETPVSLAVKAGNVPVVLRLFAHGASPYQTMAVAEETANGQKEYKQKGLLDLATTEGMKDAIRQVQAERNKEFLTPSNTQKDVTDLKQMVSDLTDEIEGLKEEVANLKDQVADLNGANGRLQGWRIDLENTLMEQDIKVPPRPFVLGESALNGASYLAGDDNEPPTEPRSRHATNFVRTGLAAGVAPAEPGEKIGAKPWRGGFRPGGAAL